MTATSTIDVLGNQVEGVNSFTSVFFNSPIDTDRVITAEIQLVRNSGENLRREHVEFLDTIEPDADEIQIVTVSEEPTLVTAEIQGIISNTVLSTNRQITTTVQNLLPNDALSNVNYYAVGAYLDVDLYPSDTVVYIADTTKFKTNGYLLIGDEVVRYLRKLTDRFLKVQRGQNNTTPKAWSAGTFLRQIPDPVSIAFGGVSIIESESQIVTVRGGVEVGRVERETERQIVAPEVTLETVERVISIQIQPQLNVDSISTILSKVTYRLEVPAELIPVAGVSYESVEISCEIQVIGSESTLTRNSTELLIIPPPSGAIDEYEESIFIDDPIKTRLNGFVDLLDDYGVLKRNGSTVFIINRVFGGGSEYIGNYAKTNAGPTIGNFDQILDDGTANVSGVTLIDISFHFPSLTIRDFVERSKSSYTLSGDYFNLTNSSIQNPVAISSISGTVPQSITVQSTSYFPDSGYLFTSGGSVIQYTSKTSNTFEGCTIYRGADSISNNEELVPFTIF
jgi:hypothetical protein